MTNIWIKTKPDSFQGSWTDHMYLGPEFGSLKHKQLFLLYKQLKK